MEATLKRKRFNFRGSLCMPYGVFMALFVVLPLVLIIYYAFINDSFIVFTNDLYFYSIIPYEKISYYI